MSHTKVKTTYSVEMAFGCTGTKELYCHHNHSCDCTTFYDEEGNLVTMDFCLWEQGNDLWDAMNRLWFPFKDKWYGKLKKNVEYYYGVPWEEKSI